MIQLFLLATVISTEGFRSFCDVALDGPICTSLPIQKGEVVFVNTSALDFFFAHIFPETREPFVLVSSGGFGTVDEKYAPFLESQILAHWFGAHLILRHPKATCIPLGVPWVHCRYTSLLTPYLEQLTENKYFAQKPFSMYVNWALTTHPSRKSIQNHFTHFPNCIFSRRVSFVQYLEDLAHSRFVISPRGKNIDCFRNWEALYAGSIPVVEAKGIDSAFASLPVIIVDDLTVVNEAALMEAFEQLKLKPINIAKLNLEYWLDLIREQVFLLHSNSKNL